MRICNLTPHAIIANGVTIPASGEVARVTVTRKQVGNLTLEDGTTIPAFVPTFGEVTGLPPKKWGTLYLVSAMVRSHPDVAKRKDVASPGNLIRDENGVIIGCDGLDLNFNAE